MLSLKHVTTMRHLLAQPKAGPHHVVGFYLCSFKHVCTMRLLLQVALHRLCGATSSQAWASQSNPRRAQCSTSSARLAARWVTGVGAVGPRLLAALIPAACQ